MPLSNRKPTACLRVTEALESVGPKSPVSVWPMVRVAGFPPAEAIAGRLGNGSESFWLVITSNGEMFPHYRTLAEVAVNPAKREFSL